MSEATSCPKVMKPYTPVGGEEKGGGVFGNFQDRATMHRESLERNPPVSV